MKLSILIPTLPERRFQLNRLIGILNDQIHLSNADCEILIDDRPKNNPSVGQKRNELIKRATGEYFCFIDDDDFITQDYISLITKAISFNPDVITFKGWMTTNGGAHVDWIIKLGEKYEARKDTDGITRYYRFPNHLCAFKNELVKDFTFHAISQGEDYQWALKINNTGVLKTEIHIDKQIYHYDFKTNK